MPEGKLSSFEGRPVIRAAVRITRAGDGLSEALKFAPVALHHDDEVFFVLRGSVSQVNHKPDGADADELVRVHTVEAVEIAMVDESDVADLLAGAAERVGRARAEALEAENRENGIFPLGDAEAELLAAHDAGEHTDLVEGCAECDSEVREVAAEKKAKK